MNTEKPFIFISSTFDDLQHIRNHLVNFIETDLGYGALAFEERKFPADPSVDTTLNSIQAVQERADVLVLIVGRSYGTPPDDDSEKSVTHLEYEAARRKDIPVFVFIDKSVLATLRIWKSSPAADFGSVVNSTKVYGFVDELQNHRAWIVGFEKSGDIIEALRAKLASLVADSLTLRRRARTSSDHAALAGRALSIVLDRKDGWEITLFTELLREELKRRDDLRLAFDNALAFGPGETIVEAHAPSWAEHRIVEITRIYDATRYVLGEALKKAWENGEVSLILFSARKLGLAYEQGLAWAEVLRLAHCPDRFKSVTAKMALLAKELVEQLGGLPTRIERQLREDLARVPPLPGPNTGGPSDPPVFRMTVPIRMNADLIHEIRSDIRNLRAT